MTSLSTLIYQWVSNIRSHYSFQFCVLNLLVLLLYKLGSSFSAVLPSFFTSGFLITTFANFKILPRPRPHCWTVTRGHQRLFRGTVLCLYGLLNYIFGGSLPHVALLYLVINVLPFGRFTRTGLSLFTIIILFHGSIFWLINLQLI